MAKIVKKSPAPLLSGGGGVGGVGRAGPPCMPGGILRWRRRSRRPPGWGGGKLFPDKVLILPDPEPAPEPEPERAAPEDPLAVERARALAELRRLDENIEDAKLSAQIVHMEEVTGKISSTSWPGSRTSCPSSAGF